MRGTANDEAHGARGEPDWAALGFEQLDQLASGYQSRAYRARHEGRSVVLKVVDGALHVSVDREARIVARLAALNDRVVGPELVDGTYAHQVGDWTYTVYTFVSGRPPDIDRREEVQEMTRTLSGLHGTMRALPDDLELPAVAALRAGAAGGGFEPSPIDNLTLMLPTKNIHP